MRPISASVSFVGSVRTNLFATTPFESSVSVSVSTIKERTLVSRLRNRILPNATPTLRAVDGGLPLTQQPARVLTQTGGGGIVDNLFDRIASPVSGSIT